MRDGDILYLSKTSTQEAQLAISDFKTMQDEIAELKVTNADLQSKLDAANKEKADKVRIVARSLYAIAMLWPCCSNSLLFSRVLLFPLPLFCCC
jgi:hypothetical protein